MKFINEYRTTLRGEYIYEFEVTGLCNDNIPSSFDLIATPDGYIPIEETEFFELWKFADNFELDIEVTTKFEYVRTSRAKTGIFVFVISGVAVHDAATLILKFCDYIRRD